MYGQSLLRSIAMSLLAVLAGGSISMDPERLSAQESIRTVPPLELSYSLIAQRKMPRGGYKEVIIKDGAVLHSHDNLKIDFKTNARCHVYVFHLDSRGSASQLFPHPRISLANPIEGDRNYEIPPGDEWFWLNEHTGTETLYLLASYSPMVDLERLLREMEGADSSVAGRFGPELDREVEVLMRGSQRPQSRPPKPIRITGSIGGSEELEITTRGMDNKVLKEERRQFKLSDGRTIEKATEVIKGYASCVKVIRFEHR